MALGRLSNKSRDREDVEAIRSSAAHLLSQFNEVWPNGREFVARCLLHADKTPSCAIYQHRDGVWMWRCFPCATGGDVFSLLAKQRISFPDALRRLKGDIGDYRVHSGPPPGDKDRFGKKGRPMGRIVATYDYRDERRRILYQVVRLEPKDFRQRRPAPDGWSWRLGDVRRVLYKLPDILRHDGRTVYVVEGEKDADALTKRGRLATTSCGGAGSWRPEYAEALRGARVVILPDNDDPGKNHAAAVFASLGGIARSATIVDLPDLPPKGDVSDWLAAGHRVEELPLC